MKLGCKLNKFQQGTRSKNERGWYTVKTVPDRSGKMTVKYDSGEEAVLLAALELTNLRLTQDEERVAAGNIRAMDLLQTEDDFIAIGFLAANSFILARMGPDQIDSFAEYYFALTGEVATEDGSEVVANVGQWGLELRITFPKHLFEYCQNVTFERLKAERKDDTYRAQVSCGVWIRKLLSFGFRIGNRHDVSKIADNVPKHYRDAFMLGYEMGNSLPVERVTSTLKHPTRVFTPQADELEETSELEQMKMIREPLALTA